MAGPTARVGAKLRASYDEAYVDGAEAWRALCGRYKARNLLRVCERAPMSRVLDCGAGDGSVLAAIDASGRAGELHALEISESGVERIRARNLRTLASARRFDGYAIPYADGTFDLAYCSHVLEHVEHPRVLLRELGRVSRFQAFEIPLDYSPAVDRAAEHLLSYGHINVYTPALFKFLLRSEGFELVAELRTHVADEVERFNWYRNLGLERTFRREASLWLRRVGRVAARLRHGRAVFEETGYAAFTCLARWVSEPRIL